MRLENESVHEPVKNKFLKLVPIMVLLALQMSSVSAFNVWEDMFEPVWIGLTTFVGQIIAIAILGYVLGKTIQSEQTPIQVDIILTLMVFLISLALVFTVGGGIGIEARDIFGELKFF